MRECPPQSLRALDWQRSLIVSSFLRSKRGVETVSFPPILIGSTQLRSECQCNGTPSFDAAVKYMDWCSESYDHRFQVNGDEVEIAA